MSPHGVSHLPKSAVSLSTAVDERVETHGRRRLLLDPSVRRRPALLISVATDRGHISSPQNTATEVGTESAAQRKSHPRSASIGLGELRLQRVGRRQRVVGLHQRGNDQREFRQVAVERRVAQRVQREVLPVVEHPDARECRAGSHCAIDIGGKVLPASGCSRPAADQGAVVRVVQPAAVGLSTFGRLVDGVQRAPFGGRVAAVDRLRPVELRVALRDEVRVEVRDVAVGVREDRVVRRVRVELHRLPELLVVLRLGARVRLRQRLERLLHHAHGDPFAGVLADDRAVMRAIHRELRSAMPVAVLYGTVIFVSRRPAVLRCRTGRRSRCPSSSRSRRTRRCCPPRSTCASSPHAR